MTSRLLKIIYATFLLFSPVTSILNAQTANKSLLMSDKTFLFVDSNKIYAGKCQDDIPNSRNCPGGYGIKLSNLSKTLELNLDTDTATINKNKELFIADWKAKHPEVVSRMKNIEQMMARRIELEKQRDSLNNIIRPIRSELFQYEEKISFFDNQIKVIDLKLETSPQDQHLIALKAELINQKKYGFAQV